MTGGEGLLTKSRTCCSARGLSAKSIDVFVTYRCSLRCKHCFVGDRLDLRTDFPISLFAKLVEAARSWNTDEITFLGGEPTLYPHLTEAIELAATNGYQTRLVTNGHRSYARFLRAMAEKSLPAICFSLDGSSSQSHDTVRGHGTFSELIKNIEISTRRGAEIGGILSISTQNAHDVPATLRLCNELGFQYVNVHHVSNRGFASSDMVLPLLDWQKVCSEIDTIAPSLTTAIRLERTFVRGGNLLHCAVREQSNLMFLPDRRVYMCMMFIDIPGSHSFTWTENGLIPNKGANSEQQMAATVGLQGGCPAFSLVNPRLANEAAALGQAVACIYEKEELAHLALDCTSQALVK